MTPSSKYFKCITKFLEKYSLLVKLIFLSLFVYIIFRTVDIGESLSLLLEVNYFILIPIFLYIPALILATYKWKLVLNYNFFELFKLYWISNFFSTFLPSTIGGDGYKVLRLGNELGRKKVLISVLIDRVTGLLGVLILAAILSFTVIPVLELQISFVNIVVISFFAVLFFILSVFFEIKTIIISKYITRFKYDEKISWNKVFLVSLLYPILGAISLWTYLYMFGYPINPLLILEFYLLIQIISMIPVSINALGIYELSLVGLLSLVGIPVEIGLSVALLSRFVMMMQTAIGGIVYLFEKNKDLFSRE